MSNDNVLNILKNFDVTFGLIDNEPERLAAQELVLKSKTVLGLADQKSLDVDFKKITVTHGNTEIPAYAVNNVIFKDVIKNDFQTARYRINCKYHRKFQRHITSITKDPDTGLYLRPSDHDDDLYFALLFAEAAIAIYKAIYKAPSSSYSVGKKLSSVNFNS